MSRMVFTLSDEDKALLEAARAAYGHRSCAETLRALIRATERPTPAEVNKAASEALRTLKANTVFSSRLKGEWKAP